MKTEKVPMRMVNVGDTVYRKLEARRGMEKFSRKITEGKIVKIGVKYAHVNFSLDPSYEKIEKVPFEELITYDRNNMYFYDMEEYVMVEEKMVAEKQINSFFQESFGYNLQRMSHEDTLEIRDIIRKYMKEEG